MWATDRGYGWEEESTAPGRRKIQNRSTHKGLWPRPEQQQLTGMAAGVNSQLKAKELLATQVMKILGRAVLTDRSSQIRQITIRAEVRLRVLLSRQRIPGTRQAEPDFEHSLRCRDAPLFRAARAWLTVHQRPSYAPDLIPEEGVWSVLRPPPRRTAPSPTP